MLPGFFNEPTTLTMELIYSIITSAFICSLVALMLLTDKETRKEIERQQDVIKRLQEVDNFSKEILKH